MKKVLFMLTTVVLLAACNGNKADKSLYVCEANYSKV
jgi:hypothetical protein